MLIFYFEIQGKMWKRKFDKHTHTHAHTHTHIYLYIYIYIYIYITWKVWEPEKQIGDGIFKYIFMENLKNT